MSKIIIHAMAGTGINIAHKCVNDLIKLGVGFADIDYKWLDTSNANSFKVNKGNLQVISSNKLATKDMAGSGAERSTNSEDIIIGVNEYMDHNGFIENDSNEFHIVIFSGNGGKLVA